MLRSTSSIVRNNHVLSYGARRSFSVFKLPDLDYDFGALEPVISAEIMQLHHQKHHNAYVTNLNVAFAKLEESKIANDPSAVIALQSSIKFNGGGHINHSIFWKNLAPIGKGGGELSDGELLNKIKAQYGTPEQFITAMSTATVAIQGSGWGWLGYDKASDRLSIVTLPNQDPLQASTGLVPLLGIDVWEHAYYLMYKNMRADYVKNIWKIVNWADVEKRLIEAKASK